MSSPREEAVLYWWNRAWDAWRAAKRDFQADAYPFAINRLYYSVFYAASALLLQSGHSFSKHSGVRSAFHKHLIRTQILEEAWGKFYDRLFEDRQEGDYVEFTRFDRSYVQEQIDRTEQFLKQVEPFLEKHAN